MSIRSVVRVTRYSYGYVVRGSRTRRTRVRSRLRRSSGTQPKARVRSGHRRQYYQVSASSFSLLPRLVTVAPTSDAANEWGNTDRSFRLYCPPPPSTMCSLLPLPLEPTDRRSVRHLFFSYPENRIVSSYSSTAIRDRMLLRSGRRRQNDRTACRRARGR